MKKNYFVKIAALVLLLGFSFNATAKVFQNERSPFAFDPVFDASLLAGGAAGTGISYLLESKLNSSSEWDFVSTLDPSEINAFDRSLCFAYDKKLDVISDILCASSLALVPSLSLGMGWLCNGEDYNWKFLLESVAMYGESFLLAHGTKEILKNTIVRYRPYMYTDVKNEGDFDSLDFQNSFPSGHTTYAFMSATFVSYVFCQYFPESNLKIPVIALSYGFAAGTAFMRVASGNHFMTDVLAGAAIGSAWGFAVPFIHHQLCLRQNADEKIAIELLPNGLDIKFRL